MFRILILCLFTRGAQANVPRHNPKIPLKKYIIDLDKAPEDRFTQVVTEHKFYASIVFGMVKRLFSTDADKALLNATKVSDEHRRELQAIADIMGDTYEHALTASMFYELSTLHRELPAEWRTVASRSCTGIVAQSADGTIYHGRNQDYPPALAPLQYDATFIKGGKVVFEGTTFAGIIGIGGTCMVPGAWSVSIDARQTYEPSLTDAIKYASEGAFNFPLAVREGCSRGGDFNAAVKFFSEAPLINPGYYIVAGASPGDGVVLTRNSTAKGADLFRLSQGYPTSRPWFLVQTNYDHWKPAPKNDDRRDMGISLMENVGQANITLDTLWEVMSDTGNGKIGIYNRNTIHTELINPGAGEYHTYMRHSIISPSEHVFV